ncbi:RDD family protein, partial [Microbacterium lemovicicum]
PGAPPALAVWADVADVARLPDRLARRIAQFVRQAESMEPSARARVAASLASAVREIVSPVPAVDPELLLRGVAAVRHDRELRALELEERRVDRLVAGAPDGPRGYPER